MDRRAIWRGLLALFLVSLTIPTSTALAQNPTFAVEGGRTTRSRPSYRARQSRSRTSPPVCHERSPPTRTAASWCARCPRRVATGCRSRSPGFATEVRENLVFNAGQNAVINFALSSPPCRRRSRWPATRQSCRPRRRKCRARSISQAFENLPVKERNYFRLLTLDSNVVATGTGSNAVNVGGQRGLELRHLRGRDQQSLEVADAAARAAARVERLRHRDRQGSAAHHQPVLGRVRRSLRRRGEHGHQGRHQRVQRLGVRDGAARRPGRGAAARADRQRREGQGAV